MNSGRKHLISLSCHPFLLQHAGSCVFEAHASVRVSGSRVVKAMESSSVSWLFFLWIVIDIAGQGGGPRGSDSPQQPKYCVFNSFQSQT